jgi:uncharacterized protein
MIGTSLHRRTAVAAGILCVVAGTGPTLAQDIELPGQLAWTAYDVGSGGYNQAVAIGGALKNELGIDLRVLPGRNDVSRQVPLRQGRVQFSATGVGASYLAQEGVFEFGGADWGPQAVRLLLAANGDGNLGIGVAADAGIETIADLAGKRVAYVVGAPSLNENITAILAFANLTWDDVQRVEFSGFGAAWEAIINDQADAAFAASTSGQAYQLEASPRGLFWPPLPHDDTEGWQRLQERAPFFIPNDGTEGAAMGPDNVNEAATYPYPVLTTYAEQDTNLVYNMTKAMVELYPVYQDSAPGINGWALDNQVFAWAVPYHEGAVEYFREAGVWTEEHDAHNEALIERQGVLAAAWEEMQGEEVAEADFETRWMELRARKLEEAGLSVVFN